MSAPSRPRGRWLALAGAVVLLAGCGNKQAAYHRADTEGLYITAGGLKYQVQISREVNPALEEDRSFVRGLARGTTPPGPREEWFAIFLRVENDGNATHRSARSFDIVDTTGHRYVPVSIDPAVNDLAYTPRTLSPGAVFPERNSIAGQAGPRGALLLFKLNTSAYQNRPLDFRILSNGLPRRVDASVELDL